MKPLLPVLRENNRYLCFEVISSQKIQRNDVMRAVKMNLKSTLGIFDYAQAHLRFMEKWNHNRSIIKVTHNATNVIKAGLALIRHINNIPVLIHTVGVSGVVSTAYENYLR